LEGGLEMTVEITTPEQVIDFIEDIRGDLSLVRFDANTMKEDAYETLVYRNACLGKIADGESLGERHAALGRMIIAISHDDLGMKGKLEVQAGKLVGAEHRLDHARNAIAGIFSEYAQKLSEAAARIDALTERIRQHSISNPEVREAVWTMTSGHCFHCEVALIRNGEAEQATDRSRVFHVDHLVPKASGGPDHLSNYVPSCERCNISKGTRSYLDFLASKKPQPALTLIAGGVAS
jgi:hypothetical protein